MNIVLQSLNGSGFAVTDVETSTVYGFTTVGEALSTLNTLAFKEGNNLNETTEQHTGGDGVSDTDNVLSGVDITTTLDNN